MREGPERPRRLRRRIVLAALGAAPLAAPALAQQHDLSGTWRLATNDSYVLWCCPSLSRAIASPAASE